MDNSEELSSEMIRFIRREEKDRAYKISPGNRIILAKKCQHCGAEFFPLRKNKKYCTDSCRVLACYARKGYQYQSGRYVKKKETNLSEKLNPVQVPLLSEPLPQKGFDWKNFGESAAASAAVQTLKYVVHDQPLEQKIDKLVNAVEGGRLSGNIKYIGVKLKGGKPVSIFKDSQGFIIINDAEGRWLKKVSRNPVRWQSIESPFHTK
jgi:hypothetical protein